MKLSLCAMIAVVLAFLSSRADDQQPLTMKRIVFHEERSNVPQDSTQQVYRKILIAGPHYLRAEVLNGGQPVHMLIRNRQELWEADPIKKTAILRDTAVKNMSLSLFSKSKETIIQGLQIGKEIEFFKQTNARQLQDEKLDSLNCKVYVLDTANTRMRLWVDKGKQVPVQIDITSPENEYKVRYDVYMTDVPFDSTVFRVPERSKVQQDNLPK